MFCQRKISITKVAVLENTLNMVASKEGLSRRVSEFITQLESSLTPSLSPIKLTTPQKELKERDLLFKVLVMWDFGPPGSSTKMEAKSLTSSNTIQPYSRLME